VNAKKKVENNEIGFEEDLKKLEELVSKLESGELPLEKSLVLFEEGVSLYKNCKKRMGAIEIKISKLTDSLKEEALD
tara:strand:- start:843 stop:1073 length:231 start_codon:yes stop_codon:yes gene_type:complete